MPRTSMSVPHGFRSLFGSLLRPLSEISIARYEVSARWESEFTRLFVRCTLRTENPANRQVLGFVAAHPGLALVGARSNDCDALGRSFVPIRGMRPLLFGVRRGRTWEAVTIEFELSCWRSDAAEMDMPLVGVPQMMPYPMHEDSAQHGALPGIFMSGDAPLGGYVRRAGSAEECWQAVLAPGRCIGPFALDANLAVTLHPQFAAFTPAERDEVVTLVHEPLQFMQEQFRSTLSICVLLALPGGHVPSWKSTGAALICSRATLGLDAKHSEPGYLKIGRLVAGVWWEVACNFQGPASAELYVALSAATNLMWANQTRRQLLKPALATYESGSRDEGQVEAVRTGLRWALALYKAAVFNDAVVQVLRDVVASGTGQYVSAESVRKSLAASDAGLCQALEQR